MPSFFLFFLLYSYPSQHLSLLGSFPFSTEIPSISMGTTTPHYFSCTYEASSLPSVFSLLHHQESIWICGGLQGTQTKAQNGLTTLPKTNLELMGLSHVGFGSQNYQNQCFTPVDLVNRLNRLNWMSTVEPVAKNLENLIECSRKSEESMKKRGTQFRV